MGRGILEVHLVDAKGLADTDFLVAGKIDPYVLIQYRSQEHKSSIARDSDNSTLGSLVASSPLLGHAWGACARADAAAPRSFVDERRSGGGPCMSRSPAPAQRRRRRTREETPSDRCPSATAAAAAEVGNVQGQKREERTKWGGSLFGGSGYKMRLYRDKNPNTRIACSIVFGYKGGDIPLCTRTKQ